MKTVTKPDTAPGRFAIDALFERYVSWREECHAAEMAYRRWLDGEHGERRLAFAAYLAAIDREEQAARTYADQFARVERARATGCASRHG
jgi:hypothetical protein